MCWKCIKKKTCCPLAELFQNQDQHILIFLSLVNKLKLKITRVPFNEAMACIRSESQPLPGLGQAPTCPSVLGSSLWVQIRVVAPASLYKRDKSAPLPTPLIQEENKISFGRVLIQIRPIPAGTSVLPPQEELRITKRHREVGLQWMQGPCSLGFMQSPPAKNLITVQFPYGNPTQEYLK